MLTVEDLRKWRESMKKIKIIHNSTPDMSTVNIDTSSLFLFIHCLFCFLLI